LSRTPFLAHPAVVALVLELAVERRSRLLQQRLVGDFE